ncbi:hypothetical protein HQ576_15145, partial [bacterium]|nr:hypothetical protein [bacterium]
MDRAGILAGWLLLLTATVGFAAEAINPFPRALIRLERMARWDFEEGAEGWQRPTNCTATFADGMMKVQSKGEDPYIFGPAIQARMPAAVKVRMRARNGGGGAIYWATRESPNYGQDKVASFNIEHDGQWHEYEAALDGAGTLTSIRLDPGNAAGTAEVDWIEISHANLHPLEIEQVETTPERIVAHVRNHADEAMACTVNGGTLNVPAKGVKTVAVAAKGSRPFEAFVIRVEAKGLPAVTRTVFLHRPKAAGTWAELRSGGLRVLVARDGSGARLLREGQLVAVLCPLVHEQGKMPKLSVTEDADGVRLEGDGVAATVGVTGDEVKVSIAGPREVEGPVLRVLGGVEQGILAGLEYLGKGERSSSKLDIESPE